jgi:hypothetical protein
VPVVAVEDQVRQLGLIGEKLRIREAAVGDPHHGPGLEPELGRGPDDQQRVAEVPGDDDHVRLRRLDLRDLGREVRRAEVVRHLQSELHPELPGVTLDVTRDRGAEQPVLVQHRQGLHARARGLRQIGEVVE